MCGYGGDHVTSKVVAPVTITRTRLGGPGTEGKGWMKCVAKDAVRGQSVESLQKVV